MNVSYASWALETRIHQTISLAFSRGGAVTTANGTKNTLPDFTVKMQTQGYFRIYQKLDAGILRLPGEFNPWIRQLDFEELIDIAERYNFPQPKDTDQLVIGWGGSWRTIGQCSSQHAGIYRPAFLMKRTSDRKTEVLMGFARVNCKSRKTVPATRRFALDSPDESRDGYTISHNHLSICETSIQLARNGNLKLANKLWNKFSKSRFIDGGQRFPRSKIFEDVTSIDNLSHIVSS